MGLSVCRVRAFIVHAIVVGGDLSDLYDRGVQRSIHAIRYCTLVGLADGPFRPSYPVSLFCFTCCPFVTCFVSFFANLSIECELACVESHSEKKENV